MAHIDDKKKIDFTVEKVSSFPRWLRKYGLRVIGFIFIFIGVLGLSFPFWPLQYVGDFAYIDTIAKEQVAVGEPGSNSLDVLHPEDMPEHENRLWIEKIGVNMPLVQSNSVKALNDGGWIFPETSTPGANGNTVIFGHRFRYLPPISNTFYALDKVVIGDTFQIRWDDQNITYRITEIKTIEPTDWSVVEQTNTPRVTLITCAPLFSTRYRLVVIGEPINL